MPLIGVKTKLFDPVRKRCATYNELDCDRCRAKIDKHCLYYQTFNKVLERWPDKARAICCTECMNYLKENPDVSMSAAIWREPK